jgi:flagellar hook assembly protein FlgD
MDTNIYYKLRILIISILLAAGLWGAAFAAPILSYEELATVSDDHVIITWVTTNETANTGIEYGIGGLTSTYTTDEGSDRAVYHYLYLSNLYPNATYTYRIFSTNATNETTYGQTKSFTTLNPPSGQLLFAFATISDPQVTQNYQDTYGARGRPYNSSEAMLASTIDWINLVSPSFTILKGDLIDNRSGNIADDATRIINSVGNLNNPVFAIPGNHEKSSWATKTAGGWYDTLLQNVFDPAAYTPSGDFSNYTYEANISVATFEDSVYNYSFDYRGYHFIMLDSIRKRDGSNQCKGHVDTIWLANDLASAESRSRKSFILMHNIITNEAVQIPAEVISEVTGGSPDLEKIDLDNRSDFLNVLSSYESDIVGVFMGHIHDNNRYYRSGLDFPFVRTASTIQYPVGFNIYKVYSNGYIQSFYKTPFYTEYARDFITPEAGLSDAYWEQLSLGSNYDRNFVITYGDITVPPTIKDSAPTDGSTNVALDQPVIITFSKEMATTETQNATTIAPTLSGLSYGWSDSDTVLTIAHSSNFASSTGYTVTVGTGARSKDNIPFISASSFSFDSGTSVATSPPEVSIAPLSNNITTDPTPMLTGTATDENSTISNIDYRIASNGWSDWKPCIALDGHFNENEEGFTFTVTPEITRGHHTVQVRATNAAGQTSSATVSAYSFYYVGDRPEIVLRADGTEIINGDPIESTPSFEVIVATDKSLTLSNLKFYINGTTEIASSTTQESNRTLTYAYYNPTFTAGVHDVRVEATDDDGNTATKEATNLLVQTTGKVTIFGAPLNYPNPFDPGTETTTISYNLSRAGNVSLRIFDLAGNQIAKMDYSANQDGGKAGYNEITWDGRSNGSYVGNGIYIYVLIVDGSVAQNGKGKLTVFKR